MATDEEKLNKAIDRADDKLTGTDIEQLIAEYDGDDVAAYRRQLEQFVQWPGWIRQEMMSAWAVWDSDDQSRKCPHNPRNDPHAPQPAHAAAWRPNYVVCDECTHL